ncbi:recombinase family protein [Janibacter melonis]|uniref:recombinase family protein n=1 Tax=Janibacter melonis TaxID=262209 RepID=UPI0020438706|nr:recombinase family protein [Janibacter melonis]
MIRNRIAERIAGAGAALQIDRSVHDPGTAMGRFFFSILATFAEFEADVASQRTKEGLAIARAKGRLNGKPPKLSKRQHLKVLEEYEAGDVTVGDLAQDYGVDRATIYRTVNRAKQIREGSQ